MNDFVTLLDLPVRVLYKKIRHTYLRVKANGIIEITANKQISNERIQQLLCKFYSSLQAKRARILAQEELNYCALQEGGRVQLLGEEYSLQLLKAHENSVLFKDSECILTVKDSQNHALKARILKNYYKGYAYEYFPKIIENRFNYFANLGYTLPKLSVKNMRTRWGSYSPHVHKINLNLALIYLETKLIDYVIVHELCHLIELNHSSRFYALMENFLPNWQQLKKELSKYSHILI